MAHPTQATCSLAHVPIEHQVYINSMDEEKIPKPFEEVMEHKVWRDSVSDETDAMARNNTWYESELSRGKKVETSRWIFTIKSLSNGKTEKRKSGLVARGFTQTYGKDDLDTFTPMTKLHRIQIVLSLATNLEWDL